MDFLAVHRHLGRRLDADPFRWAGQERLTRSIAQQTIGQGEDKLSLKGVIYPCFKGELKQLDTLRSIGRKLQSVNLTTGEVLGS